MAEEIYKCLKCGFQGYITEGSCPSCGDKENLEEIVDREATIKTIKRDEEMTEITSTPVKSKSVKKSTDSTPAKNVFTEDKGENFLNETPLFSDIEPPEDVPPEEDYLIGKTFGRCKVIEKIGHGGMGAVYKAFHLTLEQEVVMKVLPHEFTSSPELVKRFLREARSCAKLHHQNVVQILDVGREHNTYYYVMEYVDGFSLDQLLKQRGRFKTDEACRIIRDAACGLSHAHKQGIIHRDIKAGNIMLTKDGQTKVTDFGLARDLGDERISRTGQVMGTPHYMSPEQGEGEELDGRSDLYSLGITLYYMLAGKLPFEAKSTIALLKMHSTATPKSLREINREISGDLERIVSRLLAKNKEDRYPCAEDLIKDLDLFLSGAPTVISIGGAKYVKKRIMIGVVCLLLIILIVPLLLIKWSNPGKKLAWVPKEKTQPQDQVKKDDPLKTKTENGKAPIDVKTYTKGDTEPQNQITKPPETQKNDETKKSTGGDDSKKTPADNTKGEAKKGEHDSQKDAKSEGKNGDQKAKTEPENKKTEPIPVHKISLPVPRILIPREGEIITMPLQIQGEVNELGQDKINARFELFNEGKCVKKIEKEISKKVFEISIDDDILDGRYKISVMTSYQGRDSSQSHVNVILDRKPPVLSLIAPKDNVVKEEEKGRSIDIEVTAEDSLSGTEGVALVSQKGRTEMIKNGNIYKCSMAISWGKQEFSLEACDKAGNRSAIKTSISLVPKGMVRIPAGQINFKDSPVSFKSFYIDRTEVTNEAYLEYIKINKKEAPPRNWTPGREGWEKLPVVFVSQTDSASYAQSMGKRLPTEVEWIAAAVWDGKYTCLLCPWGDDANNLQWRTNLSPVGSLAKDCSRFGVYDMAGNVSEWTDDVYGSNAMIKGFSINTQRPERLLEKQPLRGEGEKLLRESRYNWLGFRCAFSEEK